MSRESLSKKTRFDVFKRDGFACQYCGACPPNVLLEVDHIIPVCEGGDNGEFNLVTSCFNCNRGKGGTPLSVVPKTLAEKAIEIKEREDQLSGYREILQVSLDRIEDDKWRVAEAVFPKGGDKGVRRDWLQSIKGFNKRLPLHEVIDAAEIALARIPYSEPKRFQYFCGICWNKIRDIEMGA